MFNKPDSQIYYLSALYDGTTGDPLDFASAEGLPDNLVAVKNVHQQAWLFGASTIQALQNTGNVDFPYATIPGSLIQYGCASPYAIVVSSNSVFGWGRITMVTLWSGREQDLVNRAGFRPTRLKTILDQYASYIPNAHAYSYQENGHYFIVFKVPNMPTDLVWDVELEQWHERGYFSNGAYSTQRQNYHVFAFGKHLCGTMKRGIFTNRL